MQNNNKINVRVNTDIIVRSKEETIKNTKFRSK